MKRFIVFILIIFLSAPSFAQSDIKTDSFKVEGNCSMCKKRIESAAYIKGVKRADWNAETHMLTVIYKPSRIKPVDVMQSVAKAGHSTEKIAATENDYKKLPECCHYKTNNCEH